MVDIHQHVKSINKHREQLIHHSIDVNTPFSSTNFSLHLPSGDTLSLLLLKGLLQLTQGQSSHEPPSLKHGQRVLMHLGLWSLDDVPQEHLFNLPFFLCFPGGVTTTTSFGWRSGLTWISGSTLSKIWISSVSFPSFVTSWEQTPVLFLISELKDRLVALVLIFTGVFFFLP